ncbi:MAG: RluA family pseudouridine synthase [Candidatus Paceibacterota bacterium]|jgi:23S rRNA pseudouridine1911/1915/1917 synthase
MTPTIQILYEDNDLLAVNKPAGLIVHADGKTKETSLADWLADNYPETPGVGGSVKLANGGETKRNGILHRIDQDTSGLILVAKNQKAFVFFQKQFLDRTAEKTYQAFVVGEIKPKQGKIDKAIGRKRGDFRLWSAGKDTRGKLREAETDYRTIISSPDFSLLEVQPKTGRTHQIRVHLQAIGHPIICDKKYGDKKSLLGFKRLALHALAIKLKLVSGKEVTLKAPYPEDFQKAIELTAIKG